MFKTQQSLCKLNVGSEVPFGGMMKVAMFTRSQTLARETQMASRLAARRLFW